MSETKKIALITGASRGIGKACALKLAEAGNIVIGTATTEKGANSIKEYLNAAGFEGHGECLNIADNASIENFLRILKDKNLSPDILVNNAGVTRDNLLLRMKESEWDEVLRTNLDSVFKLCKVFSKPMLKKRWGRIINISSVVALMGNPGQANYAAAKAGMIGFSKSLALEVAKRNITVNVVAPGFIETDMTKTLAEEQREEIEKKIPIGRMGKAMEIAAIVNFLASLDAAYITGETIQASGGLYTG